MRNYIEMCLKNAGAIHKAMEERGLYNGKTVRIGASIEVPVPDEYPSKVLAAIVQAQEQSTGKAIDLIGELLLKVNGIEYTDDMILLPDDIANLALGEVSSVSGDVSKKGKLDSRTS